MPLHAGRVLLGAYAAHFVRTVTTVLPGGHPPSLSISLRLVILPAFAARTWRLILLDLNALSDHLLRFRPAHYSTAIGPVSGAERYR